MDYFYHYTRQERWEKIQREGLLPKGTIGHGKIGGQCTHELAHAPAIFGLPSPAPEYLSAYNVNRPSAAEPHSLLAVLLKAISTKTTENGEEKPADIVLMKVHLQPGDDVRIGDYKNIAENWDNLSKMDAGVEKYCQLMAPVRDNFNVAAAMALPEVVCFNAIPANRIEFVERLFLKTYEDVNAYISAKQKKSANRMHP